MSVLTLSSIFPFFSQRYDLNTLEALIKTQCLLHDVCTIPASVTLSDARVLAILLRNEELLGEQAIKITIRSGAENLEHLAEIKELQRSRLFSRLDKISKFVAFDEKITSERYRRRMIEFLNSSQKQSLEYKKQDELFGIINEISEEQFQPTPEEFFRLSKKSFFFGESISAAAQFFYCQEGARNVEGGFEIPGELLKRIDSAVDHLPTKNLREAEFLSDAHKAVLEQFAISAEAICRVPSAELIELKKDGATRLAVDTLRSIIGKVASGFELSKADLIEADECKRMIREGVFARCIDESKMRDKNRLVGELTSDIAPELAGLIFESIPAWSLMRKASLHAGRLISRRTKISHLDYTRTPIYTYVSRLQSAIAKQPIISTVPRR